MRTWQLLHTLHTLSAFGSSPMGQSSPCPTRLEDAELDQRFIRGLSRETRTEGD
jgi:hypothetical protein